MPENATSDTYYTIESEAIGEYKAKGSKFHCYLIPSPTIEAFQSRLATIKREHLKARHHCYSYRIGYQGEIYRINDDGEPSGTAGKPIYGQLIKQDLTFAGAVVVRYFGGTKLGTSGLIAAYKSATEDAIAKATIIKKVRMAEIKVAFDYSLMGKVMQVIKSAKLSIGKTDFNHEPSLLLECPYSESQATIVKFKADYLNRSVDDIVDDDVIEGVSIVSNDMS